MARGSDAEEHPHDRADRRRQDRDRAPAGEAGAVAVHQGRSVQVHRGRLRRPRRRVDGSRPRGAGRRHGPRGEGARRCRTRRARPRRSGCSICCCRRRGRRCRAKTRERRRQNGRASACASSFGPARLDERVVELEVARTTMPSFASSAARLEDIGINIKDMMTAPSRAARRRGGCGCRRRWAHLIDEEQGRLVDMESVSRAAVQRVEQAGIIFIDEIDKIASRDGAGATAPTSAARACSATSCRSSRARR